MRPVRSLRYDATTEIRTDRRPLETTRNISSLPVPALCPHLPNPPPASSSSCPLGVGPPGVAPRPLTGTLAALRGGGLVQGGGPGAVGAHRALRDPGAVHAALHPPHDEVQQHVHGPAHVLPIGRARLEVRDPGGGVRGHGLERRERGSLPYS